MKEDSLRTGSRNQNATQIVGINNLSGKDSLKGKVRGTTQASGGSQRLARGVAVIARIEGPREGKSVDRHQ